jgi:hypothetical protein
MSSSRGIFSASLAEKYSGLSKKRCDSERPRSLTIYAKLRHRPISNCHLSICTSIIVELTESDGTIPRQTYSRPGNIAPLRFALLNCESAGSLTCKALRPAGRDHTHPSTNTLSIPLTSAPAIRPRCSVAPCARPHGAPSRHPSAARQGITPSSNKPHQP